MINSVGLLLPSVRVLLASAKGVRANDSMELNLLKVSLNDGKRCLRPESLRLRAGADLFRGYHQSGEKNLERCIELARRQESQLFLERSTRMLERFRGGLNLVETITSLMIPNPA